MQKTQKYLSMVPFDVYGLALFNLVVKHRSFTKAAECAGITQSAITRQIQGMEGKLDLQLLERTTRRIRLTPAGEFLFGETARLLGDVERLQDVLSQEYGGARKEVRVSVSRTVSNAYLPGIFHANLRRAPEIGYRVVSQRSGDIIAALEANEQDMGILCPPSRTPKTLRLTHRFQDDFTLIVPKDLNDQMPPDSKRKKRLEFLNNRNWLSIHEETNTGRRLKAWMKKQGFTAAPIMQLDNFDLLINLVELGMGVGFVPIRALAPYNRKSKIRRVSTPAKFSRELAILVRKHRQLPEHFQHFINNVLFADKLEDSIKPQ